MQYGDRLISCRRGYLRTYAREAAEHFQPTAGSLQVPHPWPDLNKVYPQQADITLNTNTRFSRRGGGKKRIIDSRNMMGLMSFPGVVFLSFCYILIFLLLLPLWPLRRAELFPTPDSKTCSYLKRGSERLRLPRTHFAPGYSYPSSCHRP